MSTIPPPKETFMITLVASLLTAAIATGTSQCSAAEPAGPPRKGDPNIEYTVHPEDPTEPVADPRSNGRWMVIGIGTDEDGSHNVVCWINSDESTFRKVPITPAMYDTFLATPDTGSIPCPPS
jgi:hypothetical protein